MTLRKLGTYEFQNAPMGEVGKGGASWRDTSEATSQWVQGLDGKDVANMSFINLKALTRDEEKNLSPEEERQQNLHLGVKWMWQKGYDVTIDREGKIIMDDGLWTRKES